MNKEIWRDIKGYEGLYQVSNMGRVKSLERTVIDNRGEGIYRFFALFLPIFNVCDVLYLTY